MAFVLMVKGNNASADSETPRLPEAFDAHEVVVAGSIDEAVAASSQRAPDLILLSAALLAEHSDVTMAGLMGRGHDGRAASRSRRGHVAQSSSGQWLYWFGSTSTTQDRSSAACRFLELARQCVGPSGSPRP